MRKKNIIIAAVSGVIVAGAAGGIALLNHNADTEPVYVADVNSGLADAYNDSETATTEITDPVSTEEGDTADVARGSSQGEVIDAPEEQGRQEETGSQEEQGGQEQGNGEQGEQGETGNGEQDGEFDYNLIDPDLHASLGSNYENDVEDVTIDDVMLETFKKVFPGYSELQGRAKRNADDNLVDYVGRYLYGNSFVTKDEVYNYILTGEEIDFAKKLAESQGGSGSSGGSSGGLGSGQQASGGGSGQQTPSGGGGQQQTPSGGGQQASGGGSGSGPSADLTPDAQQQWLEIQEMLKAGSGIENPSENKDPNATGSIE